MKNLAKATILGVAVAATTLAAMPAAEAGDRWRRHHHRGFDGGDALAAGAVGLAVGALIGAANQPPVYRERYVDDYPRYYEPRVRYYREPGYRVRNPDVVYYQSQRPVRYRGGAEPWSRGWYEYCNARYRSFNPSTGTFRGYDGRDHFCVAN